MNTHRRVRIVSSPVKALWHFIAMVLVLGSFSGVPLHAQIADTQQRIYRLDSKSTFQKGCFAPCLCPVMFSGSEEGTFVLTAAGSDGLFNKFMVSQVNWTVTLASGETMRVMGSGTYKVGGEFAVQEQLSLDLQVGDDPVQHFDSGLVAGGGEFPRIDITISINGQYCFDTVFHIDAAPVPPDQIHKYRLLPSSTFQRSCGGPCACAPGPELPMRGSFSLVNLGSDPLFRRYSVLLVKWMVAADPNSATAAGLPIIGAGSYRVGGGLAVDQQMTLDLKVGTVLPVVFDSGLVPGGQDFPRIDIRIINGAGSCVTTAINLHAVPAPFATKSSAPALEEPFF
jgi:hypothetical protein